MGTKINTTFLNAPTIESCQLNTSFSLERIHEQFNRLKIDFTDLKPQVST